MFIHRPCWWSDLHQRQWIWLHRVAYLADNNTVKTIQNYQTSVDELPLWKTVELGIKPINITHCMGMVTPLHSSHFLALSSFITIVLSTCHTVRYQPPAQVKNIQGTGHSGKDMTSTTKVVMAGLKCSPLHRYKDKGHFLQAHQECLQELWKTIQSIIHHRPALILDLNLLPVCLHEDPIALQRKHFSCPRNHRKQMS